MKFPKSLGVALVIGSAWLGTEGGFAQNLLPSPGFQEGPATPTGWQLADGSGEWATDGATSNRVVRVRGNGDDQSVWRTEALPLKPGGLYALHFRARRLGDASGGTAVAGTSRVNRDFPLDQTWREYRFCFRQPDGASNDFVRLGQWHVKGTVEFDDAELLPAVASHWPLVGTGDNEVRPGAGERREQASYRFAATLGWAGANYQRPLVRATAGFNSDRWVFSPDSEVVYRFAGGASQTAARVSVSVNYRVAGTLEIDASRDGASWINAGSIAGLSPGGTVEVPAALLPATALWVRLRATGSEANLQVNRFEYEAELAAPNPAVEGRTDFLEVLRSDPRFTLDRFFLNSDRGAGVIQLFLAGKFGLTNQTQLERALSGPTVRPTAGSKHAFTFRPGRRDYASCPTVRASEPGDHPVSFALRTADGQVLFEGRTMAHLSHLNDPRAGYRVADTNGVAVWWAESGWKLSRTGPPPGADAPAKPVSVALARGEFEAAQVLLRTAADRELLAATASEFRGPASGPSALRLQIDELAYVQTSRPTDPSCEPGWHPDPLPPLSLPRKLTSDAHLALWLTFFAGRDAAPGDYSGDLALRIKSDSGETTVVVPLAVHVYDFKMPRQTHLRSALGLGSGMINRYHKLADRADQVAVFEKYLQNFAEHRISPYSFFEYAPMQVRFDGEGAAKRARVDFTLFDAAASRWLGPGSFNTFQLPLRGMGGGTFHSRHLGQLEGFEEGTPEHARLFGDYLGQVERHLRERGWLDKAFTYWFDEPDPKDYEFVVAGQERIKAAAPGVKRMLTEQPEKALLGHVDIWCGLTPEWTPEKVRARRDAGEEVWWYICTGPKAPYVTEFIDHPGTELRLWPWQSWQYGVTGLLVWATIYWTSDAAYPDTLQDPWQDPMSWVSGYSTPKGTRSPWGNGDGRFLYPPRRDPNAATQPSLEGPVNSIRWENLRDGMEDYEYLWLLDGEVKRAEAAGRASGQLTEAKALLVVPEAVSKDLTHFTTDPRTILEHREKVAQMIERLQRIR